MDVCQLVYENENWNLIKGDKNQNFDLTIVFGQREVLKEGKALKELSEIIETDTLIGCSTSGNIADTEIFDEVAVATAIKFSKSHIKTVLVDIEKLEDSFSVGKEIALKIPKEGLKHLFVLSDGLNVNGSELVNGLLSELPNGVKITGGLAGDEDKFQETLIIYNNTMKSKTVVAVGFYGDITIGYGSFGGWDPFGPERVITKSKGNILYELDNQPALEIYKKYLGEHAKELPASGLLFPLSVKFDDEEIVRTILSVNEEDQSITFAGDVPEGAYARFMKANFDRLIDGAEEAASRNKDMLNSKEPQLAILISCVGRRLVLKQRTEEEIEAVKDILGDDVVLTGYYSYGEISPFIKDGRCRLHNQTMTITTFLEE